MDHKEKIIQGKERRSLWSLLTLFLTRQGTQISLYLSRGKCSNMTGTFSLAKPICSSALRSFVRNWEHSIFGRRKADVNKSYIVWRSNQEFYKLSHQLGSVPKAKFLNFSQCSNLQQNFWRSASDLLL